MARRAGLSSSSSSSASIIIISSGGSSTTTTSSSSTSTSMSEQDPQQRIDELHAELEEAREQIKAKDEEIASLRERLQAQQALPRADHSKFEEMQRLQEKLAELKREQAEADAAKDAAWKQLKATVVEVAQLANPEKIAAESSGQWRAA